MNSFDTLQTVVQQNQIRIAQALALADTAIDVAGAEGVKIDRKITEAIKAEIGPLKTLSGGAEMADFKIAIVGSQSTGKSTFVNAWLGFDLLPTDSKRCTQAPIQLLAAGDQAQRLDIEMFSKEEFEDRKRKLFDKAKVDDAEGRKAKAELEFITRRQEAFQTLIDNAQQSITFREFSEIRDTLTKFVTDPEHAMAVKELRLYTNHLDDLEGVVLYDIPSLDYGLGVEELADRRIMRECDMVILVQNAKTPTIMPSEKYMAKFLQEKAQNFAVSERLFVFLNGADLCDSKEVCTKNLELARREWKRVAGLPADHVQIGSALLGLSAGGAYLREDTREAHGGDDGLQERAEVLLQYLHPDVSRITEKNITEAVDEIAGVSSFRRQIKSLLREERVALFRAKCDSAVFEVRRLSQQVLESAVTVYSDNVETARRKVQDTWRLDFAKWRSDYVETEIEAAVNEAFDKFQRAANANTAIFEKYQALIDEHVAVARREEAIKARVFSRRHSSYSHPELANAAWRRELSTEIKASLDRLSDELAESMYNQLSDLLETMQAKLWNDPKVVELLIGSPELYRAKLKAAIDALILRYSRPLIEATVMAPRDTKLRQDVKTKLRNDLMSLASYAERSMEANGIKVTSEDEKDRARLLEILDIDAQATGETANGKKKTSDRADLLAFIDRPGFAQCLAEQQKNADEDPDLWFQEVEREVKDDLEFMESYLRREVFFASGVAEFRDQELRRLRDDFSSRQAYWEGIIDNAYERQDVELLKALPSHLKVDEQFTEISTAIASLKQALAETSV